MRVGENYICKQGDSQTKYIINRIMKETVDVTVVDFYQGCEWQSNRFKRYSKDLLLDQIKDAVEINKYKPWG